MTNIIKRDPFGMFAWPRWNDDFEDFSQKGLRVHETQKNIVVEAVVAGIPAEDIGVNIEDGVVTIKADRKEENKDKDSYRSSYQSYYYTTALSGGRWDKAAAEVEHGVLVLKIPKQKSAKPQKIKVKTKTK
ncbi:Hsp20/alpha crystallin family protein [Patescibacteria group bacterium]